MARLARVVVPGYSHHITQRGNRRMPTFFSDADYEAYLALLAEQCAAHGLGIWAWCLMPNHVHLVAVPKTAEGLARAVGEAENRLIGKPDPRLFSGTFLLVTHALETAG